MNRNIGARLRKLEKALQSKQDVNITFRVYQGETLTRVITWNPSGEVVYKWEERSEES